MLFYQNKSGNFFTTCQVMEGIKPQIDFSNCLRWSCHDQNKFKLN